MSNPNILQARSLRWLAISALLLFVGGSAGACEPALPVFMILGGPGALTRSFVVLLVAVAFKAALFTRFQVGMTKSEAAGAMIRANIWSTLAGVCAAVTVSSAPPIGIIAVVLLAIAPAHRVVAYARARRIRLVSSFLVILAVVVLMILSLVLWSAAEQLLEGHGSLLTYWLIKLAFVSIGLGCSIFLTTFWEEWSIWRQCGAAENDTTYLLPVLRANLWTIGLVALYAAVLILPSRLASVNFLVMLWRHLLSPV